MFNAVTDAVRGIENCRYEQAKRILMRAHWDAQEAYLEQEVEAPVLHIHGEDGKP